MISVIVPAYNEQGLIADCLNSLIGQTFDRGSYEIIVVDNNSKDLTAKIALDKGVRVEKELIKGYAYALQKGIDSSTGEIIAFTDADCRVPADWLERIFGAFSSALDIVAVGGKLSFYDINPVLDRSLGLILYLNQALPGNNMAIKRAALDRVGKLDPKVNLSLDYWLTIKLRKIGRIRTDRKLIVSTSGRRFRGAFSSDLKYFVNIIALLLSSRPMFFDFPDVREGVD